MAVSRLLVAWIASDATRHSTAVLVVVVRAWADVATAEAQVVRGVATVRRG